MGNWNRCINTREGKLGADRRVLPIHNARRHANKARAKEDYPDTPPELQVLYTSALLVAGPEPVMKPQDYDPYTPQYIVYDDFIVEWNAWRKLVVETIKQTLPTGLPPDRTEAVRDIQTYPEEGFAEWTNLTDIDETEDVIKSYAEQRRDMFKGVAQRAMMFNDFYHWLCVEREEQWAIRDRN